LAFLGIGAKVIPGVKIGAGTTVGAGAVVIEDLPENVTAVGVPARVIKAVV
jgi:acetyltransferase-like isoleucine patch superfamily enzyme